MNQRDRLLFITGCTGLALMVIISLFIKCPTISQEWTLSIALGLAAALIAACIPGVLNIKFDSVPALPVQAGGAIVVFLLVVWFKPALAAIPADRQFTNTSCQGQLPVGRELSVAVLPPALNPAQQQVNPMNALGRPVRFTFDYTFGAYAGSRQWTQVRPGVWIEMYPNGELFSAFREIGQRKLYECEGTVVQRQDSTKLEVFIPDKGCDNRLWFNAGAEWAYMGLMKSVE